MTSFAPPEDAVWSPDPRREQMARKAARPRRKPESEVVNEGITHIRARPRAYARKVHGGIHGNVGEPDVDAVVDGRACKFEAKAPDGKKPTGTQMGALKRWAKTGALVGWFRSIAHLIELLDHVGERDFVPDLEHPGCVCPRHQGRAA